MSLTAAYGRRRAGLIMLPTFYLPVPEDRAKSMVARLSLLLHIAMSGGHSLCTVDRKELNAEGLFPLKDPPPVCFKDYIRFQHFVCDFHVVSHPLNSLHVFVLTSFTFPDCSGRGVIRCGESTV
jgi:hypothetical protein